MLFVSQAPLETLQAYKRRMGWSFPWVSSANSDFNFDLGFSSSAGADARVGRADARSSCRRSPRATRATTGTDVVGYLTESFGFSAFVLDDGDRLPDLLDDGAAGSSS